MFSQNTIARIQNQKEILDQEIETLSSIKFSNDKVINKIQKFLLDED